MKKLFLLLLICLAAGSAQSHDLRYQSLPLKQWHLKSKSQSISGSFYLLKGETLYLEDAHGAIATVPLSELSVEDRQFAVQKNKQILTLNQLV